MPILNRAAELQDEVTGWRRMLHQNPELNYDVFQTAQFVTDKLKSFGCDEVVGGIGRTGVVGVIRGNLGAGSAIGLRADMDALPILEASGKPWSSANPGKMHACGHDGHTAMLLGAAKYLANSPKFRGTVALIFQPAEEGALGGQRMVEEGIMDRYGISQVFGMHNMPGIEVGRFGICDGPIMAAIDEFDLIVKGKGGHAAMPHLNIDPVVIAAQVVLGLQTLVSRSTDPIQSLVISVTKVHAGEAYNVTPPQVEMGGTVRTLSAGLRDFAERQMQASAQAIARGFGGDVEFKYRRQDPVTFNYTEGTNLAIKAARDLVGPASVDDKIRPLMISEDFAYMLEARPGAFIFIGNGKSAGLHHPAYEFDDDALPYGIGYWVTLVETVLAA